MARLFDDASAQYLTTANAVVATYPFTMAAWAYSDDLATFHAAMSIADSSVTQHYHALYHDNTGPNVAVRSIAGGTPVTASTTTTLSVNTWHHFCGVFTSSVLRSVFLDGGGKGTNDVDRTPLGLDSTGIGVISTSALTYKWSGRLAAPAIWNVALTDAEVAILAAGYSPLFVRPQNLVAYWPLIRDEDQDRVGGYDLTPVNGPSIAAHPPIIYPAAHFIELGAAEEVTPNPQDPGTYDFWITNRITFQTIPPLAGDTGDFEKWITDRIYWLDYVEAVAGGTDYFRTLSDSVGTTDTLSLILDYYRSLTDSIGVTDLLTKIGTFFIRPDGDQSVGQWTDELDGTTNIYQSINEPAPAVDSDYIQSPFAPQTQSYICTLSDALDPGIDIGHILSYRYRKFPVTNQQVDLTVTFLQGAAELIFWQHNNVTSGWVTVNQLIPSGIVANITDYTDLRLRFEADIAL